MIKNRQGGRIAGGEADHGRIHPRFRHEDLRRHDAQHLHIPVFLHQQAQRPVGVVLAGRGQAIAHFLLQHEDRTAHRRGRGEPVLQNFTAHRVRQVPHEAQRAVPEPWAQVDAGGVVVDDLHVVPALKLCLQLRRELAILLDQNQLLRPADEVLCQGAHPRADFDHEIRAVRLHLVTDPPRHLLVLEEVLPHALARREMRSPVGGFGAALVVVSHRRIIPQTRPASSQEYHLEELSAVHVKVRPRMISS